MRTDFEQVLAELPITASHGVLARRKAGRARTRLISSRPIYSATFMPNRGMGAKVEFRETGSKRLFEVDPRPNYHVKAVDVAGRNDLPEEAIINGSL